ncbi:alanine racemase [Staphylococcus gallinarum]|jgi:alanine racemase|uniref:alanine racemase n=1 Tax=Staphylococcus gallinarum TaxID=1293 RepID=UPI000D1F70C4|nr:alanine racemase [Staphylococcus gallinarum]MCD8830190.1 alanine racemase [Staphylococcus gallinarum]MCD8845056.1 alanine racemase [Staphylococcus gallinarum]MCD8918916.1 alanine racemase [Staphylococcus gallinarum]MDN6414268.1 alanine racemase [Staphylococcus gallinarum]MEB6056571.1 alanine racemase [Staphylococcus gallinarum]
MSDKYYRSTYVNVDLNAIVSNFQVFQKLHPTKTVIPVVKANGYGLGSLPIARQLMKNGAEFFAVATLDEAIELRMHGINAKLLVLGVIPTADINKALQHRIAVTVPSKSWLDEVITNLPEENEKDQWFHVKLDTGMGRLGVKDVSEYKKIIETIDAHEHLIFEGVFTHFACADEPGDSMNQQQNLFEEMVNQARKPEFIHSQNSAGALMKDTQFCNAVRIGISLYGYYPSHYVKDNVKVHLKPSAQWISEVVQRKVLQPGESVSYGSIYTATEPTEIGIIPVGYADGYPRLMSGAYVNVNGHQCEVIGKVCMDQIIIKVPAEIKVGDKVILMDHHVDTPQSAEALARQQHTINYEVLCNLNRRLPRIYHGTEVVEINNELLK